MIDVKTERCERTYSPERFSLKRENSNVNIPKTSTQSMRILTAR